MLDADTKRRIDSARDILVGKVPDPKTQVEQITFAMIYKFMDDMDQQSVSLGGKPSFFTNGYEQFAWSLLMDKRQSGAQRLDLYIRALKQMSQNPHIPQLFRDIFSGAFLPYNDAETLSLFLKEIDGFKYEHSEDLGDAYEYLLSIFSSQGKAGQFRTPRHIIDFIVDCVDPAKDETILDPACGTAGFLISAFKHIEEKYRENPLSPDEKKRLTENIVGYDISPDMVRLSRVNMYLHQFPKPLIHEYDTLTTEDRWDESFDVILANPPFMTPKGGIRPHKRFAVRANRSEVLFVDYIAEHLNPGGRAGVIVPEGIIFQSGNAYKALRKMLVEDGYLYAVVSLPAGIFNPYSGVKTSVLLMDKTLAKKTDSIFFVKVAADGFDLGAQRRSIERDDLPEALKALKAFQAEPTAEIAESELLRLVKKSRLAEDGDYNLSAERYRENGVSQTKWPMVKLSNVVRTVKPPEKIQKHEYQADGDIPIIDQGQNSIAGWTDNVKAKIQSEKPLVIFGDHTCVWKYVDYSFAQGADGIKIFDTSDHYLPKFFYYLLSKSTFKAEGYNRHYSKLKELNIPLPPIEVQREIVAEIEGYQKIIDGARQVIENYKPTIPLDPSWPKVKLGEVLNNVNEIFDFITGKESVKYLGLENIESNTGRIIGDLDAKLEKIKSSKKVYYPGDILFGRLRPNLNKVVLVDHQGICSTDILVLRVINEQYLPKFYECIIRSDWFNKITLNGISGSQLPRVKWEYLSSILVPIPEVSLQNMIVENIRKEQLLINQNNEIIQIFAEKINDRIRNIWYG